MSEPREDITCREVVELVTHYLERALPPEDAALFEQHLEVCEGCELYVEQMRMTIEATGRIHQDDVPPETRDRLVAAFRDWKRGQPLH